MADVLAATRSQVPLELPAPLRANALQSLVASRSPLQEHYDSCFERFTVLAECQATFNQSEGIADLDEAVREMIDSQRDAEHLKEAVLATAHGQATGDPSRAIFERTEVLKTNYRDLTDLQKYSRAAPYDEFKRRVFSVENPDDEYPGISSFFRRPGAQDDEELEMTYHTKRNLKCPITMTTFQNPMRSKVCVHVFSHDAVMEMIRRNRGLIKCPVAGCDKHIRAADLERDRVMERRVRDEEDEESREGEALSSEAGEDVLDIL